MTYPAPADDVDTETAWESSAWLRSAVAHRIAQLGALVDAAPVIVAPLTEPPPATPNPPELVKGREAPVTTYRLEPEVWSEA